MRIHFCQAVETILPTTLWSDGIFFVTDVCIKPWIAVDFKARSLQNYKTLERVNAGIFILQ